jgi:TRAP-type C4-dicarboxylate transport system substrate-binding protein
MPMTDPDKQFRAGGYKATGNNANALTRFMDACRPAFGDAACSVELDVLATGETAGSLFKSVAEGRREVNYMASGYLSEQVSELGVLDLPFHVTDRAAAFRSLDGEAGAMLRAAVAAKSNLRVLAFWDNGVRHVSNRVRPIRTPADCAGLVCRTIDSALYRASLAALGFVPRTTDVQVLRQVVADGEVDAQENPISNSNHFEIWKHHQHMSLTGHFFGIMLLVCNARWFEALGPAQQQAVAVAAQGVTEYQRKSAAQEDEDGVAFLRTKGVAVVLPQEIDLAAMRACCAPVAAQACANLPAELVAAYGK